MDSKICKACHRVLPKSEFWGHKGFKDGLHCNCKKCESELIKHRNRARSERRGGVTVTQKSCRICGKTKSSDLFYRDKGKKDGLAYCCKECSNEKVSQWIRDNPSRHKANQSSFYQRTKATRAIYNQMYNSINKERKAENDKIWHEANKDHVRKRAKIYRASPKGRAIKNESTRRSRIPFENAVPAWADRQAILEFYANCPKGYHVDHIIPIKGKTVCGLHVIQNLQYLTASENARKTNRYDPMEDDQCRLL